MLPCACTGREQQPPPAPTAESAATRIAATSVCCSARLAPVADEQADALDTDTAAHHAAGAAASVQAGAAACALHADVDAADAAGAGAVASLPARAAADYAAGAASSMQAGTEALVHSPPDAYSVFRVSPPPYSRIPCFAPWTAVFRRISTLPTSPPATSRCATMCPKIRDHGNRLPKNNNFAPMDRAR